jgi:hypothetical protein
MEHFFLGMAVALVVVLVVEYVMIASSDIGYEDDLGFHYGKEPSCEKCLHSVAINEVGDLKCACWKSTLCGKNVTRLHKCEQFKAYSK